MKSSTDVRVNGWTMSPDGRGTMDILWTCIFTTFLCTFTILCLNLPARNESSLRVQGRKILWMAIAIAGPEFLLTAAAGQLAAARDSVKAFHALGHTSWTYRHGFYANMGGFELQPLDGAPFPINSKHILWLMSRGYIEFPTISDEELLDKSKKDTVAKLITCFQVGYLIVQCIARGVQKLPVTTIELSTVAIVAGPVAARPYRQTPLDFVDDLTPSWALNIQPFIKLPVGPHERPLPRIGDSRLPWLETLESLYLCLATVVYASVHLTGWNFEFPSRVEQILWRVSSLILVGTTALFWVLEAGAILQRYGSDQKIWTRMLRKEDKKSDQQRDLEKEEEAWAPKQLPLVWEFWSILPIALIYATARAYILVEPLLGLRSMQAGAFDTVDWMAFIPHVG
ncbi:hypothetical protein TRIATDRAFT_39935 [Trichoderma atroviride IMI 206040]|uniref:Uncharacterized protein n=1 Tax=Hypocrea atroviridis (strain ATCC 20476 / IMI 206040) TaxID=452589 RepID=G9NT48_HYPAI|nr:uncharacterized protein TRIATDRAFT_39935 [Trichoderma atroviride IMI 206040]EHK45897.1 hypothetical protein TRIATDRAFT_39935 [Trichoderma atroviride IMI 206040]